MTQKRDVGNRDRGKKVLFLDRCSKQMKRLKILSMNIILIKFSCT